MKRYPIVIEKTSTGYSAYSPDVDGCAAVGDSERETRQNFQEALEEHLEAMREVGEPIPAIYPDSQGKLQEKCDCSRALRVYNYSVEGLRSRKRSSQIVVSQR